MIYNKQIDLSRFQPRPSSNQDESTTLRLGAISLAAVMALCVGLVSCASSTTNKVTETKNPIETESAPNRVAREAEAPYFVEVEFQKGSTQLTEQSQAAISGLLNRARAEGDVNDVKVLSWADEDYPSASRKKLSDGQRKLAARRNENLKNHIQSLRYGVDVDTHNMAERPGAVSRWFQTSDARFKQALVAAGLPTTGDDSPVTSRASHAVVLVTLKP